MERRGLCAQHNEDLSQAPWEAALVMFLRASSAWQRGGLGTPEGQTHGLLKLTPRGVAYILPKGKSFLRGYKHHESPELKWGIFTEKKGKYSKGMKRET